MDSPRTGFAFAIIGALIVAMGAFWWGRQSAMTSTGAMTSSNASRVDEETDTREPISVVTTATGTARATSPFEASRSATSASTSARAWTTPDHAALSDRVRELLKTLPDLVRRARAGDLDAWTTIDRVRVACAEAPIDADDVAARVSFERTFGNDTPAFGKALAELQAICAPYRQAVSQALERKLLARAAEAGSADARATYVLTWVDGIRKDGALGEELLLYRHNSQIYLREMFDQGDPQALWLYQAAYTDGYAFDPDPVLAAAYLQHYLNLNGARGDSWLDRELAARLARLDTSERERVTTEIERLRREFVCRGCEAAPPKG